MYSKKYKIGITHGDINGIGYEILLKALAPEARTELFTPIVYGSPQALAFHAEMLELPCPTWNLIEDAEEARPGSINIIDCCSQELRIEPGTISTDVAGQAAYEALQMATEDLRSRKIDALVTCPINKAAMPIDLFPFNGHTDYLAHRLGEQQRPLMILCAETLRVALATTHVPLSDVSNLITAELLTEKIKSFERSLKQDFGIIKPRIAVLALNPHAGDNGRMGREEKDIIAPTIRQLFSDGQYIFGPFSADGFFGSGEYHNYDGVLAMYHDQGLAPFKALYMSDGVNVTAGLKWVRTSPDHGTGFDIVGQGKASPTSLVEALYSAVDILRHRYAYFSSRKNPLRSIYRDHGNDNEKLETTEDVSEHLL